MRISNCTRGDLFYALTGTNNKYRGNIRFFEGTPEQLDKKGRSWRVRLAVHDCHELGAKLNVSYWGLEGVQHLRRSNSACWHVHGDFFNALPEGTKIHTAAASYTCPLREWEWQDFNVGSLMFPVYASESCLCEGEVSEKWAKSEYEKSKAF